jgi:L-ribulokinase
VAAGYYPNFQSAIAKMAGLQETSYKPDPAAGAVYEKLYAEYRALVDYFGRGGNDVMKRLKSLRRG